jgi:hypothetical protein
LYDNILYERGVRHIVALMQSRSFKVLRCGGGLLICTQGFLSFSPLSSLFTLALFPKRRFCFGMGSAFWFFMSMHQARCLFFFILVYSILLHLKFHHKEAINQARIKTFKLKCLILLCHVFEKEAIYRGILLSLDIKQSCRSKECQCEKYKLCVVPIVWSFMVVMIHLHALE